MEKRRLGNFISKLRKEKGLTQKELASALCITDKAVSRWETGKSYPDIEIMQSIAAYFDVSVNELLQGERIAEKDIVDISDRNLLDALKRLKKNEERFTMTIVILIVLVMVLAGVFGDRIDNLMHGVKTTRLEVTSNDAGVILSCIDGYITAETGDSAKLDFIDMDLRGDKTAANINIHGATVGGKQFSSSANKDVENFPDVYVQEDNDKAGSNSFMNTANVASFINAIDFRKLDTEFSPDASYYLTMPEELRDDGYMHHVREGKKVYIYDSKSEQINEANDGDEIVAPYAYIVIFKYDENGIGSSIANIIWPKE